MYHLIIHIHNCQIRITHIKNKFIRQPCKYWFINSLISLILYHLIIHNYTNRISTNKYTINQYEKNINSPMQWQLLGT